MENQFTRKKKRLFDELPPAQPTRADLQPLFSSFNPTGIFTAPLNSNQHAVPASTRDAAQNLSTSKRGQLGGQLNKSATNLNNKDNTAEGAANNNNDLGNIITGEAAVLLKSQGNTMFNRVQTSYAPSRSQNFFMSSGPVSNGRQNMNSLGDP